MRHLGRLRLRRAEVLQMTAKEYLSQAWRLKTRIENMAEILAFMKSSAEYPAHAFSDMPRPPQRNIYRNEDAIVRAMEYERRIEAERDKLSSAMNTITAIEDATAQAIVVKRYIDRKTWESIAVETYVSLRQVHRLHGQVLAEITAKLQDGTL
jgi:DNA-directed RNA polymerase specialized sigma subunit